MAVTEAGGAHIPIGIPGMTPGGAGAGEDVGLTDHIPAGAGAVVGLTGRIPAGDGAVGDGDHTGHIPVGTFHTDHIIAWNIRPHTGGNLPWVAAPDTTDIMVMVAPYITTQPRTVLRTVTLLLQALHTVPAVLPHSEGKLEARIQPRLPVSRVVAAEASEASPEAVVQWEEEVTGDN